MSRPWAVSAQITATSTAMMMIPHIGYQGSHAKFTMALSAATMTPTVRAQTAPLNKPIPAITTMMPQISLIQPHVVASNWKTYSRVTT